MSKSPYDILVLWERAQLWRAEADSVSLDAMRQLCLTEAARCESRVALSFSTPLFREPASSMIGSN